MYTWQLLYSNLNIFTTGLPLQWHRLAFSCNSRNSLASTNWNPEGLGKGLHNTQQGVIQHRFFFFANEPKIGNNGIHNWPSLELNGEAISCRAARFSIKRFHSKILNANFFSKAKHWTLASSITLVSKKLPTSLPNRAFSCSIASTFDGWRGHTGLCSKGTWTRGIRTR